MLYFILYILSLLINHNLRIINRKIEIVENMIKTKNLTNVELYRAETELHSLRFHRYGVIIIEPLE